MYIIKFRKVIKVRTSRRMKSNVEQVFRPADPIFNLKTVIYSLDYIHNRLLYEVLLLQIEFAILSIVTDSR